jgi:hypothetical protein
VTRRNLAVLGGFVVAGALLVLFFTSGGSDSDASKPTVTTAAPLRGQAKELVALLDNGRKVTFHAKYAVRAKEVADAGQTVTLELWRKSPQIRQDTVVNQAGKVNIASSFFGAGDVVACTRADQGPWACQKADSSQQAGPDALLAQLTGQLSGADVTSSESTIAGQPVRCFALTLAGQSIRICARSDGVPALVEAGPSVLELTAIDTDVSDDVFKPPASVA